MSHPIFMVLNPIFCYVSPKIVIFHEPLIIETHNKSLWIRHALNPKYAPLKQFLCIFPSQNQQNVKFLPEIVFFQKLLIAETQNLQHWIQHASNPKYMPLKPFPCIFPVTINKMWNFGCFLNSPWKHESQGAYGTAQRMYYTTILWFTDAVWNFME